MDDLFAVEREAEAAKTVLHQQVLARVHKRIKLAARNYQHGHNCWYVVPEVMLGVPRYDVQECIAYLVETLTNNGFRVKYTHPNLLFISWSHYLHAGKREAIRRATGVMVDGLGRDLSKATPSAEAALAAPTVAIPVNESAKAAKKPQHQTQFRDISTYAPGGIYGQELAASFLKKS